MYKILNDVGWDKVKIEVINEFPNKDRFVLNDRENEYIKININNNHLLNKQYSALKISNLQDYNKYIDLRKNKITNITRTDYIQKQQDYRNKTKDHKKEYDQEYIKRNIEYIKERRKIKIKCPCGKCVTKQHLRRHENSVNHQKYLNNVNTLLPVLPEDNQEA